jgi:hypothetical protein
MAVSIDNVDEEQVSVAKNILRKSLEEMQDNNIDTISGALAMLDLASQVLVLRYDVLYTIHILGTAIAQLTITGPGFKEMMHGDDDDTPEKNRMN